MEKSIFDSGWVRMHWRYPILGMGYLLFGLWLAFAFIFLYIFSLGAGMEFILDLTSQTAQNNAKKDVETLAYLPLIYAVWSLSSAIVGTVAMSIYIRMWKPFKARYIQID